MVLVVVAILASVVSALTPKTLTADPKDCPNVLLRKGNRILLINTQKPTVDGINPMYFNNLEDYVSYAKQQNAISKNSCPLMFLQDDATSEHDANDESDNIRLGVDRDESNLVQATTVDSKQASVDLVQASVQASDTSNPQYKPFNQQVVPPVPKVLPNPVPPQPQQQVSFPYPPTVMQPYIPPALPSTAQSNVAQRKPVPYVDASRDDAPFNQNMYPGFDPHNFYAGVYTTLDAVHDSTGQSQPGTPFSDNAMDPNWGGVQYTRAQVNSGKYDENMVTTTLYSSPPNTFMIPSMRPLVDPAAAPATQAPPLTSLLST